MADTRVIIAAGGTITAIALMAGGGYYYKSVNDKEWEASHEWKDNYSLNLNNYIEDDWVRTGGCIKSMLGSSIEVEEKISPWDAQKNRWYVFYVHPPGKYLAFDPKTNNELGKGCLVVNWKRKNGGENNKWWKGYLRWEWALVKGDEAFVFTGGARNSKEHQNKLDIEVKYAGFKKEKNKWLMKYFNSVIHRNEDKDHDLLNLPLGFSKDEIVEDKTTPKKKKVRGVNRAWGFGHIYDKACKLNDNSDPNCKFDFNDKPESFIKRWDWKQDDKEAEVTNCDHSRKDKNSGSLCYNKEVSRFSDLHANFHLFWNEYIGFNVSAYSGTDRQGKWTETPIPKELIDKYY